MNYQTRAFQISFLLHSLILVVAITLSTLLVPSQKLTVLDFNLNKPEAPVKKIEPPAPMPVIKANPIKPKAPQTLKGKEPDQPQEEKARTASAPEVAPVVKLPEAQSLESRPMGLGIPDHSRSVKEGPPGTAGGSKEGSGTSAGPGNSDGGKESAKTKYLKDHFAYIRDKILRNISYPDLARRMGWQGKVLLSFIITADGYVREVRIIQGSGFNVLDKTAIETVKDTAPFPKPPIEAQLVIPIIFRLDS
jgi:periplasmic protein TonB